MCAFHNAALANRLSEFAGSTSNVRDTKLSPQDIYTHMPLPTQCMASLQKALVLSAPQAEFEVKSIPIPNVGSGMLLIKIAAAALNPADWKMHVTHRGVFNVSYPCIGGYDGAGTVEEVGTDVTAFAKGDRVMMQVWMDSGVFHGTFRQYIAVPPYVVAKIPRYMPFDQAAPLFTCVTTVAISLYSKKAGGTPSLELTAPWEDNGRGAYSGKSVFIPGGASNVGQLAIQFARLSGFNPIITTASLHNQELLESFGATHVIDRMLPAAEIIEGVQAIAGGAVDIVYDPVSQEETMKLAAAVLRIGGAIVITLPGVHKFIWDVVRIKKIEVILALGVLSGANQGALDGLWARLPEWLEEGLIKPVPYEVLPGGLSAIPAGLERHKRGQVSATKLVVLPQETA